MKPCWLGAYFLLIIGGLTNHQLESLGQIRCELVSCKGIRWVLPQCVVTYSCEVLWSILYECCPCIYGGILRQDIWCFAIINYDQHKHATKQIETKTWGRNISCWFMGCDDQAFQFPMMFHALQTAGSCISPATPYRKGASIIPVELQSAHDPFVEMGPWSIQVVTIITPRGPWIETQKIDLSIPLNPGGWVLTWCGDMEVWGLKQNA